MWCRSKLFGLELTDKRIPYAMFLVSLLLGNSLLLSWSVCAYGQWDPLVGYFFTFGIYLDSLRKLIYLWVLLNSRDVILKNLVFQDVLHSKDEALSWLKVCKAGLCLWQKLSWVVWTSKPARRKDGLKLLALLAVKMQQRWWNFCEAKAVGAVMGRSRFWVMWGHLFWVPVRKGTEFFQLNWSSNRLCVVGCDIPAQGFILKPAT